MGVGAHRLSLPPRHEDQRWGAISSRDPRDQPASDNGDHDRRLPRCPEEPTQGIAEAADPVEAVQDRAGTMAAAAARVAALIRMGAPEWPAIDRRQHSAFSALVLSGSTPKDILIRDQLLVNFRIIADRQNAITEIAELSTLAQVGFFPVWLVVVWTIAEYADTR